MKKTKKKPIGKTLNGRAHANGAAEAPTLAPPPPATMIAPHEPERADVRVTDDESRKLGASAQKVATLDQRIGAYTVAMDELERERARVLEQARLAREENTQLIEAICAAHSIDPNVPGKLYRLRGKDLYVDVTANP